ncbi:MAG: hypothetical protein HY327_05485 [Chloroflexi bacterium]|nr:hypothetical protein [Chloroflexota bacterium]
MLITDFPKRLQEEFERTARRLYGGESVSRALIEAIELWLAQHRLNLMDAEREANDRAYEQLRAELERQHWGKWVVIADGVLQGIGDSLEQVNEFAPTARDRIVMQVGATRPSEVELGWQMTFA